MQTADQIVDRRLLRRALTRWRIAAIAAAILAVAALVYATTGYRLGGFGGDHIARVTISGFISGDRQTLAMLDRVARARAAKAVIVTVSSPGGTVPGSEALHEALRKLARAKPTVAVVGSMAASGGYIAAIGTDRIFAQQTSLVGSIGVIFQYPDVTRLLDTVGVKVEQIKSTPLKAEPSGMTPTSPAARAAVADLVADTYTWFRGLVRTRRGFDDAALERVADGRVFTGRQALDLKLIDAIGDETAAIDWLVAEKRIARRLPVRAWSPSSSAGSFGWPWVAASVRLLGFEEAAQALERSIAYRDLLGRDGLLAVWLPSEQR